MDFDRIVWGTPVRLWLLGIAVALGLFVGLLFIRRRIARWLASKAGTAAFSLNNMMATLVRTVSTVMLFAFSLYIGSLFVHLG